MNYLSLFKQYAMFCLGGSLSYFARTEAKDNLSGYVSCVFCSTILSEERVQVLLFERELGELPDYRPNIFKKLNIDLYMEPVQHSAIENTVF